MVFPNAPRFIRDGDMLSFTAKVSNLSDRTLHGNSTLQILDAVTMVDITKELVKTSPILNFDIEQGRSAGLVWDLLIPDTKYHAITYRISAQAGGHSDGEENTIPVITNRILLTESMPMAIKGNESKTFVFKAFENNSSTTKRTSDIQSNIHPTRYGMLFRLCLICLNKSMQALRLWWISFMQMLWLQNCKCASQDKSYH
ncbi:MAG: hypothetical protein IPL55_06430 [Saprospiraceae bacterium]|nr:hypothetical protein [Saprospiraceae bacterium]